MLKFFPGFGVFTGDVTEFRWDEKSGVKKYEILYSDGDLELLNLKQVHSILKKAEGGNKDITPMVEVSLYKMIVCGNGSSERVRAGEMNGGGRGREGGEDGKSVMSVVAVTAGWRQ